MPTLLIALLAVSGALAVEPVEGPVRVTVVGTEITIGEGGPQEPVTLEYSTTGGRPWTALFAGAPVKPEGRAALGWADDAKLVLLATGRNGPFRSDGRNALVLRGGERLADFLAMNHVRDAYARQRPVGALIAPYLDAEGKVNLDEHRLLVLFELGTVDQREPAYDFQDLVVLVEFEDLRALAAVPRRTPGSSPD